MKQIRPRRLIASLILIASASMISAAQERFVRPIDQASQDASFVAFRDRLIKAVDAKDSKFIYTILDPQIKLSFGGDSGVRTFRRVWKPESKQSEFWPEFASVIKNGGNFVKQGRSGKLFTAPYLFNSWPDDLDAFEQVAIFGNNVNLRSGPSTDSAVKTRLSYNVVTVDHTRSVFKRGSNEVYEWYFVKTLGGQTGFVNAEFIRSSIDLRAGFEKKRGAWKMVFLLAGD